MSSRRLIMNAGPTPSERPHDPRFVRPSGERREKPVRCRSCSTGSTWAIDALCTACHPIEETDPS